MDLAPLRAPLAPPARRTAGTVAALWIALALAPATAAPHEDPELARFEHQRIVMGTLARVVVLAPSEQAAREGAAAAFERMLELDAALSDWREDSELARLCAAAGGPPVVVGADLLGALREARAVAEASGGAFDPTVGPLTRLWRAARAAGRSPEPEELRAARALVGWEELELDAAAGTARLARPGMGLDLGGIGKGLACREALLVLADRGLPHALVELGGDLVAGEPPPGRAAWRVALDCGGARDVTAAEGGHARVLDVAHAGVATSGDAEQHLDAQGQRFSHVLDPRTGLGLTHGLCASVVAPDGALADALASAVLVLGAERGAELVARYPGAWMVLDDPTGGGGEAGSVALFDGRTLAGWTTVGGRYDGHAVWTVEDGCIVGRTGPGGAGGLLYTAREHHSFDLELEVRLEHPFDSGVFVRMAPEGRGLQVTLDDREGGEIAGIYSDGWLQQNPAGERLWRRGEWNHVRVRCTGADPRLEVWIGGLLAIDYALPPGTPGFAPTGRIGLQVHEAAPGSDNAARFRNLRVRELPLRGEPSEAAPQRGSAGD